MIGLLGDRRGAAARLGSNDVAVAIAAFTFLTLKAITPLENSAWEDFASFMRNPRDRAH